MTMSFRSAIERALDDNGNPISGAKLYHYNVGGTTPRTVYSDSGLTIALAQPIVADAAGKFPQVFLQQGAYRYRIYSAEDVLLVDADNVDPGLSSGSGALSVALGGTGATDAAGARSSLQVPSSTAFDAHDDRITDIEQTLAAPFAYVADSITYASSLTLNVTSEHVKTITLTGNLTLNAPTMTEGQEFIIILVQDGTGNRTVTWNSAFKFDGGTAPAVSRSSNAVDVFVFRARTSLIADCLSAKIQDGVSNSVYDILLEDTKPQGTGAGNSVAGSDITRDIAETYDPKGYCTVSGNTFTLLPGTYQIEWEAPGYACNEHQSMLYDVTGAATLKRGTCAVAVPSAGHNTWSAGTHVVTITASTGNQYQIRQRFASDFYNGMGYRSNFGNEIYTRVKIKRIA